MTDAQIGRLDKDKLTQAQQTALDMVQRLKNGERVGATCMARYIVDREEGKAVEHIVSGEEDTLSDAECEELRAFMREQYDRGAH